ncbi:SNARE associated protein [Desulfovibrio sp. X2]|uniref:DedA family protein n=1 Tax=Desulfovibrio sp. X2 TaxID=941449 RepID=UPI000358D4E3|nr:DedA family protein [Desulfovibrio sp. X2]EPR44586.1 SNARE associated protein [Desulfovibrio sp. X2]
MHIIAQFIDFLLHVDVHLAAFLAQYGAWTYLLLFAIIFCETGLVVTPVLPGDSLLFVTGALSGAGLLHGPFIFVLLAAAAIAGDSLNYWIGRRVGPAVFTREKTRFFKKEHLLQAHEFYERHGGKAIVLGRFLPIIRTFAPFVAGIAAMSYKSFVFYNVTGALLWVGVVLGIGHFFGNLPIVRQNMAVAIYGIIVLSCVPAAVEFVRARRRARAARERDRE